MRCLTMICIFNASCFCTIGLCIVLTLLVCVSSVFTQSEEPLVDEKPVPNQDDMIFASQIHNKVFSNMVVKPVLFQLENSPKILKEMQENQLQIKVKHESKTETYINPESMGLASLSDMRMKLTQKAISELTIDPFIQENILLELDKKYAIRKRSGAHTKFRERFSGSEKLKESLLVKMLGKDRVIQLRPADSQMVIKTGAAGTSRDGSDTAENVLNLKEEQVPSYLNNCGREYGMPRRNCYMGRHVFRIQGSIYPRNAKPTNFLRILPTAYELLFLRHKRRIFLLSPGFPYLTTNHLVNRHLFVT